MLKPFSALTSAFFPEMCFGCDKEEAVHEKYLCHFCCEELPRFEQNQAMSKVFHRRFPLIAKSKFYGLYLYSKGGKVQNILNKMKYRGRKDIAEKLGSILAESIPKEIYHALIPIPMHTKKRRKRGYNQTFQIAKGISKKTKIPIFNKTLKKVIDTKSQTEKGKIERLQDISKAYEVQTRLPNSVKRVLLVDDVITTGSTLDQCTDKLKCDHSIEVDYVFIALAV